MNKNIALKDAKCTGVELLAPVLMTLAEDDQGQKAGNGFKIEAYTGEVVDRWFGKLVVDMSGMMAAAQLPIFRDHDRGQIVGFSEKSWIENSFFVEGLFSNVTDTAKDVKGLADEGFPWQASIGVKPGKVLSLEEEKDSMEVNGNVIHGPAEVWLESTVHEVSFVPLGADGNTNVSRFSKFEEVAQEHGGVSLSALNKPKKGDEMEFTIELLTDKAPELLKKIQADATDEGKKAGAAAECLRIQEVAGQLMPGHRSLIEKLMFDGKTTAGEAAIAVLQAEKSITGQKAGDLNDDAVEELENGTIIDPKPAVKKTGPATLTGCQAEFDADPELVEEFGDIDTYFAFRKADQDGRVRVLGEKD
ncbi:MAG: hypothetical protein KAI40_03350 [Desulfobacterales bacterium]|nr:hypothetical protein [Desulfobacterales bacterium]